jgi:hypothetical protein
MSKKLPKYSFWLLLTLLFGIWGGVGFEVYSSINKSPDEIPADGADPKVEKSSTKSIVKYLYKDDVRDPFLIRTSVRNDSVKKAHKVIPIPWTPPPYTLTGILSTLKKRCATIQNPSGAIYFLHEGDTLSGITIMTIRETSVVYLYQKQKAEWRLGGS